MSDFNSLQDKAVDFSFTFDGFTVVGEVYRYRPNKKYWNDLKASGVISSDDTSLVKVAGAEGADPEAVIDTDAKVDSADRLFNAQLAGMLKSWDLTMGGNPVPLTIDGIAEVVSRVPTFAVQLCNHLRENRNENPPNGTDSSPGSPEKEKTENVPIGTP